MSYKSDLDSFELQRMQEGSVSWVIKLVSSIVFAGFNKYSCKAVTDFVT